MRGEDLHVFSMSNDSNETNLVGRRRGLEVSDSFVTAVVSRAASMALPDQVNFDRVDGECALWQCVFD